MRILIEESKMESMNNFKSQHEKTQNTNQIKENEIQALKMRIEELLNSLKRSDEDRSENENFVRLTSEQ